MATPARLPPRKIRAVASPSAAFAAGNQRRFCLPVLTFVFSLVTYSGFMVINPVRGIGDSPHPREHPFRRASLEDANGPFQIGKAKTHHKRIRQNSLQSVSGREGLSVIGIADDLMKEAGLKRVRLLQATSNRVTTSGRSDRVGTMKSWSRQVDAAASTTRPST